MKGELCCKKIHIPIRLIMEISKRSFKVIENKTILHKEDEELISNIL